MPRVFSYTHIIVILFSLFVSSLLPVRVYKHGNLIRLQEILFFFFNSKQPRLIVGSRYH